MLDPKTIKLLPAPPSAAALQPRLGVLIHFPTDGSPPDGRVLDIARTAGFSFVRTDLFWSVVERNGQYDFAVYDKILAALEARGMGALFIIDFGHPAHSTLSRFPWTPLRAEDVSAYARFARAAAAHFRGHHVRYEIWNEPNIPIFWQPAPDASQYAAIAKAAIAAVRLGDPNTQVATGGIGDGLDFLRAMLATNAHQGYDAIGVHPYRNGAPEGATTYLWAATGILNSYTGRPTTTVAGLWDTEWGYSSSWGFADNSAVQGQGHSQSNRTRQAIWAVRKTLTDWVLNMPVSVWYDLRDDGNDPADQEHNFGLVDSSLQPKPALLALQTLNTLSQNRKYLGLLDRTPVGLHIMKIGMKIGGLGGTTFVAWQKLVGRTTQIAWPKALSVSALDMLGRKMQPVCVGSACTINVSENAGPVYLTFARGF